MDTPHNYTRVCLLLVLLASALPVAAASFDALYVLGDSLSDVGNRLETDGTVTRPRYAQPIPDSPYAYGGGRYSNGPVWVETLAVQLGLRVTPSALGDGQGYAYGGARSGPLPGVAANGIPTLVEQAGQLAADTGTLSPQALVVIWGGGNDVRDAGGLAAGGDVAGAGAVLLASVQNIGTTIATLAGHGANHFLVPNLPDLSLTPAALAAGPAFQFGARQLTTAFNAGLAQLIPLLSGSLGVQIRMFDTFAFANQLAHNGADYGFANTTEGCAFANAGLGCDDPGRYLFWDAIHPSAHFHELLGLAAVPVPPSVWMLGSSLCGLLLVRRRARGLCA